MKFSRKHIFIILFFIIISTLISFYINQKSFLKKIKIDERIIEYNHLYEEYFTYVLSDSTVINTKTFYYFDAEESSLENKIIIQDNLSFKLDTITDTGIVIDEDVSNHFLKNNLNFLVYTTYSGGAHCCTETYIVDFDNINNLIYKGWGGNFNDHFIDLDSDGILEIEKYDQRFMYWKTSYVSSAFTSYVLDFNGDEFRFSQKLTNELPINKIPFQEDSSLKINDVINYAYEIRSKVDLKKMNSYNNYDEFEKWLSYNSDIWHIMFQLDYREEHLLSEKFFNITFKNCKFKKQFYDEYKERISDLLN